MKREFNMSFKQDIIDGKVEVVTDCGEPIEIVKWNCKGNYPILAVIDDGDTSDTCFYDEEGLSSSKKERIYVITNEPESEDEGISKWLYDFINNIPAVEWNKDGPNEDLRVDILAWLEKQCEQKAYTLEQAANIFLDALSNSPYNNKPITDAQVIVRELIKFLSDARSYNPNAINEKKPAWSEKYIANVFEKVGLAKIAREQSNDALTNALQDAMIELSKFIPQPKQEWSEEDEATFTVIGSLILDNFSAEDASKTLTWLHSLTPHPQWKPSDEQIIALRYVVTELKHSDNKHQETIEDLYNDLEKLREG